MQSVFHVSTVGTAAAGATAYHESLPRFDKPVSYMPAFNTAAHRATLYGALVNSLLLYGSSISYRSAGSGCAKHHLTRWSASTPYRPADGDTADATPIACCGGYTCHEVTPLDATHRTRFSCRSCIILLYKYFLPMITLLCSGLYDIQQ